VVRKVNQSTNYPIAPLCCLLGLPRSSYYYQPPEADESALRAAVEAVAGRFPTYGSRRVTEQLQRPPHALSVNRKHIQRLMREMGLQRPVKRRTYRTTDSRHGFPRYPNRVAGLDITHPDQVWVSDITYIRLASEFVFLAVIMDVFTRSIRGWQLSRSLDQFLTLTALQRALASHTPTIHHSDQGVQYAATAYVDLLKHHQVQISMAAQGAPEENPFAERLMRTIKEEEVDLSDYRNFDDALAQIGHFIEAVYQHKRIHSALDYLTPAEFERAYWMTQAEQMSSLSLP